MKQTYIYKRTICCHQRRELYVFFVLRTEVSFAHNWQSSLQIAPTPWRTGRNIRVVGPPQTWANHTFYSNVPTFVTEPNKHVRPAVESLHPLVSCHWQQHCVDGFMMRVEASHHLAQHNAVYGHHTLDPTKLRTHNIWWRQVEDFHIALCKWNDFDAKLLLLAKQKTTGWSQMDMDDTTIMVNSVLLISSALLPAVSLTI